MTSIPAKKKPNKLFKALRIVSYVIVSLYLFIWMFSPIISRNILNSFLTDNYQVALSDETTIRYNPFTSHLSISDLSILRQNEVTYSLDRLDAEIRLHRLLSDELFISELEFEGMFAKINLANDELYVAGINLEQKSNEASDDEVKVNTDSSKQYKLILPQAVLSELKFDFQMNQSVHKIVLKQLNISNVYLDNHKQELSTRLLALVDNAPFNFEFDTKLQQQEGTLNIKIGLSAFNLEALKKDLSESVSQLSGNISFNTEQVFNLKKNSLNITSAETKLEVVDLNFATEQINLSHKRQALVLEQFNGEFSFEEGYKNISQLLNVKSILFQADDLSTSVSDAEAKAESQKVEINEVKVRLNNEGELKSEFLGLVATLGSASFDDSQQNIQTDGITLNLGNSAFSDHELFLDSIELDNLNAKITLKKQLVNDSETTNKNASAESTVTDSQEPATNQSLARRIKINQVKLINAKEIKLVDESISPNYRKSVSLEKLILSNIDSDQPNQNSPFELLGKSDEYTQFSFSGMAKPFSDKTNLELKGKLTEFPLAPASSYVQKALGFEFETGELDTELDIKIVDSKISGNTNVKIRGFNLAAAENYDQDSIKEQTAMPLNMALGMLKDSDDNLELDIPMSGNTDSPSFGASSFFTLVTQKAIKSAATSYLMKTFVPYANVVSLTISAGEFVLKTRFEDLEYQPMQTVIDDNQTVYMEQFISLMKDKEKTQVKVCAVATNSDYVSSGKQAVDEQSKTEFLKILSIERMNLFKAYVVEKGIESSRVLLCAPKVDISEQSTPHIAISV